MRPVTSEAEFNEIIRQDKPTLAVFKADWCKDCHFIDPFMPEVESQYADSLTFVVVDRDQLPELCEHYHILGIPSFIMFRNGQEVTRFVSKLRKTREEIEQYLDKSLQVAKSLQA
ncbi:thioredoxin family protein [Paenibacillus senegalensis]|uniref:thioredoxin family protein n=1 Tax=Paenibacillus senegalensis TaxID=1465766 RepID=UPI000287BCD9|nr:thioredoxin family protein [Paenibacillus senegalensis]